jgi:hypothetical protein
VRLFWLLTAACSSNSRSFATVTVLRGVCSLYIARGTLLHAANLPADNTAEAFTTVITDAAFWQMPLQLTFQGGSEYGQYAATYLASISVAIADATPDGVRVRRSRDPDVVPAAASHGAAASRRLLYHAPQEAPASGGAIAVDILLFLDSADFPATLSKSAVQEFGAALLADGVDTLWANLQQAEADSANFTAPTRVAISSGLPTGQFDVLPSNGTSVAITGADAQAARAVDKGHKGWHIAVIAAVAALALCALLALVCCALWRRRRGKRALALEKASADALGAVPREVRASGALGMHSGRTEPDGKRGSSHSLRLGTARGTSADATHSWVLANASAPSSPAGSREDTGPLAAAGAPHSATPELICDIAARARGNSRLLQSKLTAELAEAKKELHRRLAAGDCVFQGGFALSSEPDGLSMVPHSLVVQAEGPNGRPHEVHVVAHPRLLQREREVVAAVAGACGEGHAAIAPRESAHTPGSAWTRWKVVRSDGSLARHLRGHRRRRHLWPFLETMRVLGQASMQLDALHQSGAIAPLRS